MGNMGMRIENSMPGPACNPAKSKFKNRTMETFRPHSGFAQELTGFSVIAAQKPGLLA